MHDVHGAVLLAMHCIGPAHFDSVSQIVEKDHLQAHRERKFPVNVTVGPARVAGDQRDVARLPGRAYAFPGDAEMAEAFPLLVISF